MNLRCISVPSLFVIFCQIKKQLEFGEMDKYHYRIRPFPVHLLNEDKSTFVVGTNSRFVFVELITPVSVVMCKKKDWGSKGEREERGSITTSFGDVPSEFSL